MKRGENDTKKTVRKTEELPNSVAEIKTKSINTASMVFAHNAIPIVESHDGTPHVETDICTKAKEIESMAIVSSNDRDFDS